MEFSPNIGVILYKADDHLHNGYCILFFIEKKYNTTSSISIDLSCIWTGEAPFHDRTVKFDTGNDRLQTSSPFDRERRERLTVTDGLSGFFMEITANSVPRFSHHPSHSPKSHKNRTLHRTPDHGGGWMVACAAAPPGDFDTIRSACIGLHCPVYMD
ncbi:hypothetical protein BO83DRAFT_31869 [Aspergillus eucalypticola CBS 122712]|uniref:Uncharacterized protein n=1 Tax=Aspergillus eucalypticola (strain CBS 122712 / IBT 29274) TaxID=1448314 RepID=A0A317VN11_ASPEC|nr:uncharacterized protein BO83DRAFT_31869 [Aspergillus eucalypticola CBS 122712]PWY73320.1 hypothetical protein BO83DRAFT_31869 [Aspergillus eucalypticola CBS 122712]